MSNITWSPSLPSGRIAELPARAFALLERIPVAIPQLLFRSGMGLVFWRSAQSKLASWDTTILLFQEEYKVPLLPPEIAAYLATTVELTTPVLLILGWRRASAPPPCSPWRW